ncbi:MAG: sulfite exporter TauE/SafE family protein [Candidatus Marinarcus sp.]|uniref:sulfite exporter TauE/SafE family protein n=1 Tax=Candidatus Marinarcus sp. TaxID=3100987 RepID=UPI003AFF7C08
MENISLLSIITIAVLGSFGHCVGMCGGIVIAYSSTKVQSGWSKSKQTFSHILYSFGRVVTYTILGAVFGFLGSVVTFSRTTNGSLLLFTGILMLFVGLSLLGKLKFLTFIEHTVAKQAWYQRSFKILITSNSLNSFFLLGMLNGLLPCGFVYFFAITAASTGNVYLGALVMFIFGVSTIPALFSLGFFVGLFKQSDFRSLMVKLAAIAVLFYGFYIIYLGSRLLLN